MHARGFAAHLPPCIDLVLLGRLRSVGEPQFLNNPDDLLGHSIYAYEVTVDRAIFGAIERNRLELHRAGHALRRIDSDDAVVFLRRNGNGGLQFADAQVAVRDRQGRLFLPLFWPADRQSRRDSWLLIGFERFIRPVHYTEASMKGAG